MKCLITYVLLILIIFLLWIYDLKKENFYDPYSPETRPDIYPDQNNTNLNMIAKYIDSILKNQDLNNLQKLHLEDLLNLIQFI